MGGFLHFVETELQGLSSDELKACGLGHAFTKAPASRSSKLALDGKPAVQGLLLWQSSDFKDGQGVNVDKQKWRLRGTFDGRRVWAGFNTDDPPTPEVLFLGRTLRYLPWEDSQGREWRMPLVGVVDGEGERLPVLPRQVEFDADGNPLPGQVVSRYRELWDASSPLWVTLAEKRTCDTAEAAKFATRCLATLYRVSQAELNILEVFSEESMHSVEVFTASAIGCYPYWAWEDAKRESPLPLPAETNGFSSADGSADLPAPNTTLPEQS